MSTMKSSGKEPCYDVYQSKDIIEGPSNPELNRVCELINDKVLVFEEILLSMEYRFNLIDAYDNQPKECCDKAEERDYPSSIIGRLDFLNDTFYKANRRLGNLNLRLSSLVN